MWIELGYWGLFLASFLAATVVPFSSEVVLSGVLAAGGDLSWCLFTATLGNWLGGLTSFGMGYLGRLEWIERYLGITQSRLEKVKQKTKGKEVWIATMCWVPGVGDVIAVVLGLLKANWWLAAGGMLLGKMVRYVVWGFLTMETISYF